MTDTTNDPTTLTMFDPVTNSAITCYDCGETYAYLGEEPHPGTCHHCGADAVDPAGELTYQRCDALEVATTTQTTTSTMRIVATDARDREFEYWLHVDDPTAATAAEAEAGAEGESTETEGGAREAVLWRVYADGVQLVPPRVAGTPACPISGLEDLLAASVPTRFQADTVTPVVPDRLDSKWERTEFDTSADRARDHDRDGDASDTFDDDYWW